MISIGKSGELICIRCRRPIENAGGCRRCFPNGTLEPSTDDESGARPGQWTWRELTSVYDAPHEIAAISVQTALEAEGVPAVVRSSYVPGYGGVAMTLSGSWGWVLVSPEDVVLAIEIIERYLLSLGVRSTETPVESSERFE